MVSLTNPPSTGPMVNNAQSNTTSSLPPEVITCLNNARFLHLATCQNLEPHVSLMNYTYLARTPWRSFPTIIMTTPPASQKTQNLLANPRVSLLVHDWVTHRPPTLSSTSPTRARTGTRNSTSDHVSRDGRTEADGTNGTGGELAPEPSPLQSSSLATFLATLNSSALSSISATIVGTATMLAAGTEEERWCKAQHLANNTFGEQVREERRMSGGSRGHWYGQTDGAGADADVEGGDGGRGCFIEGDEVRVVLVRIERGRGTDWKGTVRDWVIETGGSEGEPDEGGGRDSGGMPVSG